MIETVGLKSVFRCPQSLCPGATAPRLLVDDVALSVLSVTCFWGAPACVRAGGEAWCPGGGTGGPSPASPQPRRPSAPAPSCRPCRSCTERRSSRPSSQRWAGRRTPSTSTPSSRRGRPQVCAGRVGGLGYFPTGGPLALPGGARHPGVRGPHVQGRVQGQSPSGLLDVLVSLLIVKANVVEPPLRYPRGTPGLESPRCSCSFCSLLA